ncbi:5'-nucleotidase, cytosolic IB [Rhinolophus ferrumequinum]|uniref:5'-nucleotidase, cytosolic IB n=1 Tax=Rhinolophus ferrumequinum TaxID=59479 RepID=A0A7J7V8Q3_RHIFE|nr:5'-nucleotidase, cytosolic IB [Rhinolophus ferrumequinum]
MSQTSLKQKKKNESGTKYPRDSLEAEKKRESEKSGVRLNTQGSQELSLPKTDSRGYIVRSEWSRTSRSPSNKAPSVDENRSKSANLKVPTSRTLSRNCPRSPSRPPHPCHPHHQRLQTPSLPHPRSPSPSPCPSTAARCMRTLTPGHMAFRGRCGTPGTPGTPGIPGRCSSENIPVHPPLNGSPMPSARRTTPPSWTATVCLTCPGSGRKRTTMKKPIGHP